MRPRAALRRLWQSRVPPPAMAEVILPSPWAIAVLVGLAPLALVIAAVAPPLWGLAPALGGVVLGLVLVDGARAGRLLDIRVLVPAEVEVGAGATITILADVAGRARSADAVLALDDRLAEGGRLAARLPRDAASDTLRAAVAFAPNARCQGAITAVALRWRGPLGLGLRQHRRPVAAMVRVVPDLALLRSPALQAVVRDAELGLIARRLKGEGTVFEALSQYQPGMDRRRIDWKVSARHIALHAREYEAERNNRIVFALDCGHGMCEPIGEVSPPISRLDRAVGAALATAWVALKSGDRCALFGFDARVRLATPFISGAGGFGQLCRAAAGLDYSAREPNFTLALAALAARLERRALIVIFADFTDPTSAALMVESVGRLLARHRVLFVTMRDEELLAIARHPPADLADLAAAVSAGGLLAARALVLARLRGLGVDVIEAPAALIGTRLLDAYLALRQAGAIG